VVSTIRRLAGFPAWLLASLRRRAGKKGLKFWVLPAVLAAVQVKKA